MKVFYDCEFLENGQTIKLISIGMIREDGREYYAVNAGMPWYEVLNHDWLALNVLPHLPNKMYASGDRGLNFDDPRVKSPSQIAREVRTFLQTAGPDLELWAWYGAYDHVALCQLWGRMIDLPPGIPMWTNDIRQEFERLGNPIGPEEGQGAHNALADARHNKVMYEFIHEYANKQFREAVIEAMHPELGYWCDQGNLHSGLPPKA